jgi:hypothetical protein
MVASISLRRTSSVFCRAGTALGQLDDVAEADFGASDDVRHFRAETGAVGNEIGLVLNR